MCTVGRTSRGLRSSLQRPQRFIYGCLSSPLSSGLTTESDLKAARGEILSLLRQPWESTFWSNSSRDATYTPTIFKELQTKQKQNK